MTEMTAQTTPEYSRNGDRVIPEQLTIIWGENIWSEFKPVELVLLSRFDRVEVDALGLTPQKVLEAYLHYIETNRDRLDDVSVADRINAFRLDFMDITVIQATSALEGTFSTRLKNVSNTTIIAACFGSTEARQTIQDALGTENKPIYNRFAELSNIGLAVHNDIFAQHAVQLSVPQVELNLATIKIPDAIKALITQIEELLKRLQTLIRDLDRKFCLGQLRVALYLINLLKTTDTIPTDTTTNPIIQKAQEALTNAYLNIK